MKGSMRISAIRRFCLLPIILLTIGCWDDNITNGAESDENILYAYPNSGKNFYQIDYNTFEVIQTHTINLPDDHNCYRMCLSTNRDHLILAAGPYDPPFPLFLGSYDLMTDSISCYFITEFHSVGAPRLAPALIASKPGLAYIYTHLLGLYAFDFIEQKVVECISEEHGQSLGKYLYHSPDMQFIVILKKYGGLGYSEIEFYDKDSRLHDLMFVLNKDDVDSVSVYDMAFSEDCKRLYVTFQASRSRSRGVESYFGFYDLETKQLNRSTFTFPWSLNPYYMAFSSERQEAYCIGAYDDFFIIDTKADSIKDTITIAGKVNGPSRILLRPDEEVAFVSCAGSDFIAVIDLNSKTIITKIEVSVPYLLLIP